MPIGKQGLSSARLRDRLRRVTTWTARGTMWAGLHYGLWAWDKFFEFVLYPIAIINLGLVMGTGVMMVASFAICWTLLLVYDWVSTHWVRDALGLETVKSAGDRIERWLTTKWLFRRLEPGGKVFRTIRFLLVSIWLDPMTCVVIMRTPNKHTMGTKEWRIFLLSTLLSNVVWGLLVFLGAETLAELFPAAWEQLRFI